MIFNDLLSEKFPLNFSSCNTIGFDSQELKEMYSEELLNLRVSVLNYLNCRRLKHRNSEFMNLFKRINHELKERKIIIKIEPNYRTNEAPKNPKFLGKKLSFSNSLFEIDFPNFLNDKEFVRHKNYLDEISNLESFLLQTKKNCLTNRNF